MRRGACPALSAPMMTGDGLLARIALDGAILPRELIALCRLAARHGNGMMEISARGNLQIRGLTETSAHRLDADIRGLDLPLREGLAVEVPPLAGLDASEIADPRPLAEAIARGARDLNRLDLNRLAPKISVVVDGGGHLRLSGLIADIRLVAVKGGDWKILLGGMESAGMESAARVFAILPATEAVDTVLDLLRRLAAAGETARGRDLAAGLPRNDACATPASPFGLFSLSETLCATGIGPAFGQTRAETLIALCEQAARLGMEFLKPAFDHTLIFFGPRSVCRALNEFAAGHGFVTSSADPRGRIAACSGHPACGSAFITTHEIAGRAAGECGDLLDGSFRLHIAGCAKGCAHPQPSALALCGTAAGISLIHQGKVADAGFASIAFADTGVVLGRLADLVRQERQVGEDSATCLARLGAKRLSASITPSGTNSGRS